MSDELLQQYSLLGHKGKKKLAGTVVLEIITGKFCTLPYPCKLKLYAGKFKTFEVCLNIFRLLTLYCRHLFSLNYVFSFQKL